MATVQCRDRQNIHESKDDRQESCHVPELVPVPRSREDTADRSETAQLLRSFFREQVFHIAHIAFQRFHTKRDACREVNVTDDGVGPAARLDWNRFADTVTGPLTRAVRADRYTLLRKAVEALPENDRQILMCAMRKQQLPGAKTIVLQEDPAAFMIVTSASQVLGKGYKSLDEEEL